MSELSLMAQSSYSLLVFVTEYAYGVQSNGSVGTSDIRVTIFLVSSPNTHCFQAREPEYEIVIKSVGSG
jgi:hypothetical protein